MRLTQSLKQKPTVSPQLVLANRLLQFSSIELEQAIAQELAENPALERRAIQRCPQCGLETEEGPCPVCGGGASTWDPENERRYRQDDDREPMTSGNAGDRSYDPFSWVASSTTLAEHLLHQARLVLDAADLRIAQHLVGSLDDRGFITCDLDCLASDLGVDRASIDEVLSLIHSLDPIGVAARDAQQCLLIQIEDFRRQGTRAPLDLARRLITDHWNHLHRVSVSGLAQDLNVLEGDIRDALRFIRENLNPFPAHTCWAHRRRVSAEPSTTYPQPDVIVRERAAAAGEYKIELPKAGRYELQVSGSYRRAMNGINDLTDDAQSDGSGWTRWEELCARARLFARSVEQRWSTLESLMRCLIECQRDFLLHGERCLRPLTRAGVAEMIGVHESTVSRAVAGKYVALPDGRVVPLETFFDSAAPIKRMIEDLVEQEEVPLSDRAIAEELKKQGYDVARRTVAKYRNALHIPPSSMRRRSKELWRDG